MVKFGDTSFQVIGPRRCALRNRAQEAGHSEAVNIDPGPAQGTSGHVAHLWVELGRSISPAPHWLTFWPEDTPSGMIHAIPEALAQVPGLSRFSVDKARGFIAKTACTVHPG